MSNWDYKTLDQMGTVQRGRSKHRPRNDSRLFGGAYPFIQTADVKNAPFYISEYSITYNDAGLSQSKLWDAGTLCITIAANIADTGILAIPACFPDSILGFRPFEEISDVRFVKYCFDILQRDCKSISQGAAQDNLSWEKLSTIKFPCPPLPVQRRIADILSAYDDLIENNRKQIKLLEEAAQRLYKEWFIDLRFPGHEHTPIINGIPAGWKVGPAIDFFNITIGKTPPRSEHQCFTRGEAGIPWVSISDMGASGAYMFSTAEGLTRESVAQYNVKIIPAGTILLSFKLTLGRVTIATESCCTNEAIAHFYMPETKLTEYTYLYLRNFKYDTLGNTSSISRAVNSSIVKGMTFVMPPSAIISEFSKLLKPLFQKIYLLQRSALLAQSSRDHLLPKLTKGEFDL